MAWPRISVLWVLYWGVDGDARWLQGWSLGIGGAAPSRCWLGKLTSRKARPHFPLYSLAQLGTVCRDDFMFISRGPQTFNMNIQH